MTVDELYEKLSSPAFQDPKNGDLFYNFFVYQYPARKEYAIRRQIKDFQERLKRPSTYMDALTLDLFEEFCHFLDGQSFGNQNPSLLQFLINMERQAPDNIQKVLIQQANSSKFYEYIYQRIQNHIKLEDNMKHGFIFVYGIGDIFPYLQTNVFLTNFERYNQTDKYKLIVFYPGHQVNNCFSLFDLLDYSNTYRATMLLYDNNEYPHMTSIQHLYKKDINRPLNPAVSADDFSAATIQTEIDEYVFTDEIINGLYQVLHAIWTQNVSHNGIWSNGFFGSGKSHFLKYLGYCINPHHREAALQRLKQAVSERDPLLVPDSKSQVTIDDLKQLAAWIQKATIDVVLFNIGTVHNTNSDEKEVFTQVFWNQFNRFRGYNAFNLALAQNLEKVLDRAGVFATFKERLDAEGFNWNEQAAMLATVYLDHVLEVSK